MHRRLIILIVRCIGWLSIFGAGPTPVLRFRLPSRRTKSKDLFDSFIKCAVSRGTKPSTSMQPRHAVHAVVDGVIAKLFLSKPGGNTIYLSDNAGVFCYYYAHLDGYAPKLAEASM